MSVVAVLRVKDERDIIESTVRRMREQADHVIVEDNGSTDGTLKALRKLGVEVLEDPTVAYFQSAAMSRLAEYARVECGATWVIPGDADEVWRTRSGERIADVLSMLPDEILIAEAQLYDHVATGADPLDEPDPVTRIAWRRRDPVPLPKVAVRALPGLTIHQGNHGASFEGIAHPPTVSNLLRIEHFPYRSADQLVRKVRNGGAAYAAAGDAIPLEMGAHWRAWSQLLDERGEDAIAALFEQWYYREAPDVPVNIEGNKQPALIYDPVDA